MEPRSDVVTFGETKYESETSKATPAEVAALFNPNDISAYRKQFASRFKPAPKPSHVQRVINWFRRLFA